MSSTPDDEAGLQKFRCPNCPYTTSEESALKIHLRYMHKWKGAKIPAPSKVPISTLERQISGTFMCSKCPYTGSTEQGLYSVTRE